MCCLCVQSWSLRWRRLWWHSAYTAKSSFNWPWLLSPSSTHLSSPLSSPDPPALPSSHQHVILLAAADGLLESSKESWQNETNYRCFWIEFRKAIFENWYKKVKQIDTKTTSNFFAHKNCCRSNQHTFDLWIHAWHKIVELLSWAMYVCITSEFCAFSASVSFSSPCRAALIQQWTRARGLTSTACKRGIPVPGKQ